MHPPYATRVWARAVRTCRIPGETGAVNLPMNTSTHVLNPQRVLPASSSFCMHESWVPGMFGTLQECLVKNMRGVLAAGGLGYPQRSLELHFQILGVSDRSYLSHFGSTGFPVVMGLQALFLTRCPILDLKKHLLVKMFLEMFQRKVHLDESAFSHHKVLLSIPTCWYPDFHFAQ